MDQRICLVTGGTSGVGRATATGLAGAGARVVLVTRSDEHGTEAVREITARTGSTEVDYLVGDLTSTTSVRALADRFKEQYGALHVLSNNAALLKLHPGRTETGVNEIIAANYLGHFLLTNLLLDLLKANAPARVITVAGQAGVVERISCPEIGLLDVPANRPLRATLNAVLAKVLFARELARRLDGSGVTSNVFHPGLVKSGLGSNLPWYLRIPYSAGNALLRESCPTSLFLALDEGVQTVTGAFFAGGRQVTYHAPEQEEVLAHRLWEESARLVGIA